MTIHPAIKALEQEIEKLHKRADSFQDSGLYASAYNDRREADGLEVAIKVIKPHLGRETES